MKINYGEYVTGDNVPAGGYREPDEIHYDESDSEVIAEKCLEYVVEYLYADIDEADLAEIEKAYLQLAKVAPTEFFALLQEWEKSGIIDLAEVCSEILHEQEESESDFDE